MLIRLFQSALCNLPAKALAETATTKESIMLSTKFTDIVGCRVPIQQAGMGLGLANPRLAAAVATAGGLGMVSVYGLPPETISQMFTTLAQKTSGTFGANFIMNFVEPSLARESIESAAACSRLVEFSFSDPDPHLVDLVHQHDALACWQVGSKTEAFAAVDAGCDLIVVQGTEAGGHQRGSVGLLSLLTQVLDSITVPVVAAGGIGTGRAMAAALAAGADAVRVGTRFVATNEAGAHENYVDSLIAASAADTVRTNAFSADWAGVPHRVLRGALEAADAFEGDVIGNALNAYTGERYTVHHYESVEPDVSTTGAVEAMAQYAGESVDGVRRLAAADVVVRELADEAERLLRRSW
jgi:nitronate monooxygenase